MHFGQAEAARAVRVSAVVGGVADSPSRLTFNILARRPRPLLHWVAVDSRGPAILSPLEPDDLSYPQRGVKLVVAKERALPADPPQGERLQGPTPSRTEP